MLVAICQYTGSFAGTDDPPMPAEALPAEIYSVESVRNIDTAATDGAEISGYSLMNRAGEAAVTLATDRYPDADRWQVICGAGNNGGDGYVVARLAADRGIAVSVVALSPPDELQGDAAKAYMDFAANGGALTDFDGELDHEAAVLIDAVLGSGLERDVTGRYAEAVAAINAHDASVISLDMPSGLHGDSGAVLGTAVHADHTITFVGLKSGLFLDSGPDLCGDLHFDGLDVPPECYAAESPIMRRIAEGDIRRALPRRKPSAHKGDFGHVVIIGGGPGMPGAVRLCGEAALRTGAGLVSIATHASHSALVAAGRPELMCHGVDSAEDMARLAKRASVVAIGPGLGTSKWAREMLKVALRAKRPLVVDADALNLLAAIPGRMDNRILTPHPGEAGRLLEMAAADVQRDRRAALRALQERYGGTVILKGAGTLVSAEDGPPWLCSAGNPGMASPGMGDALTGIVASLWAQGCSRTRAAVCGVEVHARAGDAAAADGERGLIASDLLDQLRSQVNP